MSPATLTDLPTPALVVEADLVDANLATMAAALPGARLRPHVKAHKCSELAGRQAAAGHRAFTCATIREVEVMAAAGLGTDLLLANEVLDARRLGAVIETGARVTVAVDSPATVAAAAAGGVREVVIDVYVGMPRCGIPAAEAGELAEQARRAGLEVRGVMGYEGHVVALEDRDARVTQTGEAMALLLQAAKDVGTPHFVSGGGTGTFDVNTWATEIQAGSYALMDTHYGRLALPFGQALTVLATVISVGSGWYVADCGLKAFGMDHGNPTLDGRTVWYVADEHLVFSGGEPLRVGDRIRVPPAHVDPTVAYHDAMWLVRGEEVLERWPVDMRGW